MALPSQFGFGIWEACHHGPITVCDGAEEGWATGGPSALMPSLRASSRSHCLPLGAPAE